MTPHNETIQSVYAYGTAGGVALLPHLAEVTSLFQFITIVLAVLIGVLRLVYDAVRLQRYLKEKKDE